MGRLAEMQRKLLEQMMGPEAMGIQPLNLDWWNEKVCRNFLFGTCLHSLFGNTKMDLGPCPKVHSDRILKSFQEHAEAHPADPRVNGFRQEHENHLYQFVEDCDRRIRASQRKLEKTPEENRKTVDLMREIGEIELSIQGGTEEIEALGEAGKVEESMEKLAAVDALKGLKTEKEQELQHLNENAGASGHQKLRVCETCGAMLSVLDSDKRLADHFGGKLHLGYHELRKILAAFAEARMTGRPLPIGPPRSPKPDDPTPAPAAALLAAGNGTPGLSAAVPAGPKSAGLAPPSFPQGPSGSEPHTPHHSRVPPSDEMPVVGHGDKVKREAGELVEDLKEERAGEERDRYRSGDRDRGDRDRGGRYDDRDRSRYDDRDRGHRDERYDRDRRNYGSRERSRSPARRRVL
ncbi:hypothetical protein L202_08199 [Cryptococcus amylolentus CBS 6039]|uniref:Uncharacterized protein n=1 Tax=Cryptococcus amylolentus CBS 6039 TaxID=1295533 RepID=A0A1E3H8Z9_9TREE|nr:hypothetical protein L202_08199 [Cryptococcus amylolentus CBS 6039]ODN72764.1 hypothetical protein L202_08199 [Cryptococcus amylolentus CBS 6039]